MDARAAESALNSTTNWLARERASGRFYTYAAIGIGALLAVMLAVSGWVLSRGAEPGTLLSPPLAAGGNCAPRPTNTCRNTGSVDTADDRRAIAEAAQSVSGVRSVINNITIR